MRFPTGIGGGTGISGLMALENTPLGGRGGGGGGGGGGTGGPPLGGPEGTDVESPLGGESGGSTSSIEGEVFMIEGAFSMRFLASKEPLRLESLLSTDFSSTSLFVSNTGW